MLEGFFFLVAGVQPRVTVLDERPVRCPRCGLHQARRQRVDHYLSLFFIPLIRVKTGEPMLVCDRCERPVAEPGGAPAGGGAAHPASCRRCGGPLEPGFRFCPRCGSRL